MRIGQEPYIKNQIRVFRNTVLESKADARYEDVLARGLMLELLSYMSS